MAEKDSTTAVHLFSARIDVSDVHPMDLRETASSLIEAAEAALAVQRFEDSRLYTSSELSSIAGLLSSARSLLAVCGEIEARQRRPVAA